MNPPTATGWRRFDTLFVRLFVLMWVTLVVSHFVAFASVTRGMQPPGDGPAPPAPPGLSQLPTLPSLPPGNPFAAEDSGGPGPGPGFDPGGPGRGQGSPGSGGSLPRNALWADYLLRMVVIALGAALGARWLSAPMRRLSDAAGALAQDFGRGRSPQRLEEGRGTLEVRQAAHVFNDMATRLREQFDARGMHMAALSHDLRTPLTRLRMRIERAPEATVLGAAADIREMDELIATTLSVLREQQQGDAARPVDLSALLQAICDDLAEQGHAVALALGAPLRAQAHPAALRRVVGNLLGNALRYGGSARLALQRGEGGTAAIVVDDDGPGIPDDQIEQAFRPWTQLHNGVPGAGHGLGLAIARDLAERDGGVLTLLNRPEGGLRAVLLLPAIVSAST
jgi:signal transduction histidine kinase